MFRFGTALLVRSAQPVVVSVFVPVRDVQLRLRVILIVRSTEAASARLVRHHCSRSTIQIVSVSPLRRFAPLQPAPCLNQPPGMRSMARSVRRSPILPTRRCFLQASYSRAIQTWQDLSQNSLDFRRSYGTRCSRSRSQRLPRWCTAFTVFRPLLSIRPKLLLTSALIFLRPGPIRLGMRGSGPMRVAQRSRFVSCTLSHASP